MSQVICLETSWWENGPDFVPNISQGDCYPKSEAVRKLEKRP